MVCSPSRGPAEAIADSHCTGWAPGSPQQRRGQCLPEGSICSFIVDTQIVTMGLDKRLHMTETTGGKRTLSLAGVTPCPLCTVGPTFSGEIVPTGEMDSLGNTGAHPFAALPSDRRAGGVQVLCWSCPLWWSLLYLAPGWPLPGGSVTLLTPSVASLPNSPHL